MNCFTPYCYCANFGNIQTGEAPRDYGTIFVVATVKTTNNPTNRLIARRDKLCYSYRFHFPVLRRYNVIPNVLTPLKTNMPMYTDK